MTLLKQARDNGYIVELSIDGNSIDIQRKTNKPISTLAMQRFQEHKSTLIKELFDEKSISDTVPKLIYRSHRTIRHNPTRYPSAWSALLVFENIKTGDICEAFFNVDATFQRGINKGKLRKTGANGEFLPPAQGTFRKLYLATTGKEPDRWCRVSHTLKKEFKNHTFTGDIEQTSKKNGTFLRLKNVRPILS